MIVISPCYSHLHRPNDAKQAYKTNQLNITNSSHPRLFQYTVNALKLTHFHNEILDKCVHRILDKCKFTKQANHFRLVTCGNEYFYNLL